MTDGQKAGSSIALGIAQLCWRVIKWMWTGLLLLCLCCVNTDSLEGRFEDDDLQQILDDIKTQRSFQY